MAVSVSEWDHTFDSTPGTSSQATASHSYTDGYLYVVFVTQKNVDSVEPDDPTLSGLGASWVEISGSNGYWDQTPASMRKTSVFRGEASGSSTGAVTVSYATYTPDTIDIVVLECTGASSTVQVVDFAGSWSANGTLDERITMAAASSSGARVVSYVAANVALITQGSSPDPRMELTSDSGGDADWTTFSNEEYSSSPTGFYSSGWLDSSPDDDLTPGWVQFDDAPAAVYIVGVEISAATASPTSLPGWGITAAQGIAPSPPDTMWLGQAISPGPLGGGPSGETPAEATARFDGYLTAAYGSSVGIQIGRRFDSSTPTNFTTGGNFQEFSVDVAARHRVVSIKGSSDTQPTAAQILTLMNSTPNDGFDTWYLVHHEPENDGGSHTTSWFDNLQDNLHSAWVSCGRDDVRIGVCYMTWFERDGNPSTDTSDWFPTSNIADFAMFLDPYDTTGTESMQDMCQETLQMWRDAGGSMWGVAETGSVRTGSALADWIHTGVAWCRAQGAICWCWYHSTIGIGVLLNDPDGRLAMAEEIVAQGG